MAKQAQNLFEFGPFQLDVAERMLRRDLAAVPLAPKTFETLLVLVENSGHLLEKEELMQRVWAGSFVEDANLTQQISTLRKVLGDEDGNRYIETVPKRGYRFIAPVTRVTPEVNAGNGAQLAAPTTSATRATVRLGWSVLAASLLLLVYFAWRMTRSSAAVAPAGRVTLVVLPFDNLSGDPAQEYFADGLTEEMIAQLSQVSPGRLAVIARTSAMKYKGARKDVAEIGRELSADYVLEGSVRRENSRVRITAQLVRVSDQTHLWAETYQRELREVLVVQGEVARAIVSSIGIELSEAHRMNFAAAAIDPQAHEDYLRGRYFWNKLTIDGYQRAIQYFESAITRQPDYAEAYAGLADAYSSLGLWGLPGQQALQKAKAAAQKAVALRESLADGHVSLAFIAMGYEWDWQTAEREFRRALELNPGHAHGHHRYGYLLMLRGRWNEAEAELKQAQKLDPLSMIINANIGFRLYLMRQYDAALAHWNKNLEMDSNFLLLHGYKGCALTMLRKYPEAIAEFQRAQGLPGVAAGLGYIYGAMGDTPEARRQLARLLDLRKKEFVPAFYIALLYTGMGDKDQAFAWLERAYDERSGYLMEIHVDPMFDPIRSDPRYAALMRRIGHQPTQPPRAALP